MEEDPSSCDSTSAGIPTPAQTIDELDDAESDGSSTHEQDEDVRGASTRWKDTPSAVALFTPIATPHASFGREMQACFPPNDRSFRQVPGPRPVFIDAIVHAAFRVSEALEHTKNATNQVAEWAKTREPPYTAYTEAESLRVQELVEATSAAKSVMDCARRSLVYDLKRVVGLQRLWYAGTKRDRDGILDGDPEFWWRISDDTYAILGKSERVVQCLHKLRAAGRSGWQEETRRIVENLDVVRANLQTAMKDDADGVVPSMERGMEAVQCAAKAVQQLANMANRIGAAVHRHRFWQWGAWMKGKEASSPEEASRYLFAKLAAEEARRKANAAAKQAMVAAKATEDYK